jgi:Protein of unknown function (DUF3025)
MADLARACAALTGVVEPPMPWLAPYRQLGTRVAAQVLAGRSVAQALNDSLPDAPMTLAAGRRLCFVAEHELPAGEAYECFIARTGRVPTRDHPHDLFNGLVWLRFGALKRQLNRLHVVQIERAGIGATRGALRDALTLFDENAALLQAPAVLVDALRRRDWQALFVVHRAAWAGATLTLFGHALLEKLLQPRKPITAHVRLVPGLPPGAAPADALIDTPPDELLSRLIELPHLPLPVLGVPGWWADNEEGNFYRDESVFRGARKPDVPATRKVTAGGR